VNDSLLSAPTGLHATTPDKAVRDRSWDYVSRLIDICADLGQGGVLVFGSGKQRSAVAGSSVADATRRFEEWARPHGDGSGSAPRLANVVTSLEEAVAMVKRIGSPSVRTMFDTHNAAAETLPHAERSGCIIPTFGTYT
jgi:D-psicose/D-tagatose/L-ribulose 3-epimerase